MSYQKIINKGFGIGSFVPGILFFPHGTKHLLRNGGIFFVEFEFKSPRTLPSVKLALTFIVLVVGVSTALVRYYEGLRWLDAFLMVIESMTHAHFGRYPTLIQTKLILTFLTIFGVGVLVYAITVIVEVVISGDLMDVLGVRRMDKKINEMHDHIVLCGHGTVGSVVAEELAKSGMPIVVIERNPDSLEALKESGTLFIEGNCKDLATLQKAGITRASFLVTALGDDNETLVTILAAKELNPKIRIVVRVVHEDYAKRMFQVGAERIILPEYVGGMQIAESIVKKRLCRNMSVTSYEDLKCDLDLGKNGNKSS